ncbi:hypothetical protein BBP40_010326 [Aspergillus hancockii]|nr:hypothetical protein BBP40_010326 [Aspergillus hancockii]
MLVSIANPRRGQGADAEQDLLQRSQNITDASMRDLRLEHGNYFNQDVNTEPGKQSRKVQHTNIDRAGLDSAPGVKQHRAKRQGLATAEGICKTRRRRPQ